MASLGHEHSLCIGEGNVLWVFGGNNSGQLGVPIECTNEPYKLQLNQHIDEPLGAIAVSASFYTSSVVDENGNVWIFGNCDKIIGKHSIIPQQITGKWDKIGIHYVALGETVILALDLNNEVWGLGSNANGQLGIPGNTTYSYSPIKIETLNSVNIKSIKCGQSHSVALDEDGHVYSTGSSSFGQTGLPDVKKQFGFAKIPNLPAIQQISAGWNHVLFLTTDGNVLSCGCQYGGRLGYEAKTHSYVPQIISSIPPISIISTTFYQSILVDDSGYIWLFGKNEYFGNLMPEGAVSVPFKTNIGSIIRVSEGGSHVFAQNDLGEVWGFGSNSKGQLAKPDSIPSNTNLFKLPETIAKCMFVNRRTSAKSARK